ncbi:MAG: ribonuclease T [Hyphomicrobiaceae bacterium]
MSFRRLLAALAAVAAAAALVPFAAPRAEAQLGPGPGGQAPYAAQRSSGNEAGRFDYYSLVLSWSPTYCAGLRRGGYDPQCHRRDGKRYAFVLHGLWPQHERGWPQNCPTRSRPFVPQRVIDGMLDIMPSPKLVIHEYRKHGTCSGLGPEEFFKVSRRLYEKVRVPPRYVQPNQAFTASPAEVIRDFLSVNPTLKADQLAVSCGGPGNRLREIRVCFSREGTYRACGRNEDARRLCGASRLYVPPVRGGSSDGDGDRGSSRRDERRI